MNQDKAKKRHTQVTRQKERSGGKTYVQSTTKGIFILNSFWLEEKT